MLRCTRDTALLQLDDHHQDHEQHPGDDRCYPPGTNLLHTTVCSTTRSSGISRTQARASHLTPSLRTAPTWGNGL